jgi:hypothetical protein
MAENGSGDTSTLDVEKLSDSLGEQLFGSAESGTDVAPSSGEGIDNTAASSDTPPADPAATTPVDEDAEVPKSWPKEMHPHWPTTPKEVRQYWKTREKQMLDGLEQYKSNAVYGESFKKVLDPYLPHLHAANIQETELLGRLLNAHWRLTQGSEADRRAAYQELGRNLGFEAAAQVAADAQAGGNGQAASVSPEVKQALDRLNRIEQTLTASQQAQLEAARASASKEVEVFASDKAHPYFDECADDIVRFIQQGFPLGESYEKAVWANPVTRTKELARLQTEKEAKARENARLDALPKKKAASVNLNSRDTRTAPTEPVGSLDETLKSTLRGIRDKSTT